jgi:hypothetical protein
MFNILGHKENANQNNTWDFTPFQSQWLLSRTQTTTNAGENVEEREHFCTVDGNVN